MSNIQRNSSKTFAILDYDNLIIAYMCVCVCVCVRERERERELNQDYYIYYTLNYLAISKYMEHIKIIRLS